MERLTATEHTLGVGENQATCSEPGRPPRHPHQLPAASKVKQIKLTNR